MRYCANCILPDTRPGLEIGLDGVCSACREHGRKEGGKEGGIDWEGRRTHFERIVAEARAREAPYDCVIPVSGGKDSHWQTVVCLEHGLHPLAVTWRTPARTELGQRNLDNLISLGVDHVDFSINPEVERKFMLASLERFGTPAVPMHLAIFNIPTTIAARYGIPLVVQGENSAMEYIGDDKAGDERSLGFRLDSEWVRRYGATQGTTAEDWVSGELTRRELTPYLGPSDRELEERGVQTVFLGWFFNWDPERTASVAREHGFETRGEGPKTGFYDYADIDDEFIAIHHWIKWLKFGFTRTWDNLSLEIRGGRTTREQAIEALRERVDEVPHADIDAFCGYVRIPKERFFEIVERFRNSDIWTRREDGVWVIEDFLVPDWPWADAQAAAGAA